MEFRKKTTATLLIAIFMISAFAFAVIASPVIELDVENNGIAEKRNGDILLETTGALPSAPDWLASDAKVRINMPSGTKLKDILPISWEYYLYYGYAPHVDIILVDDALVVEYAYNDLSGTTHHKPCLTMAYYTTFKDGSGNDGPAAVTDTTMAWATTGASGPVVGTYTFGDNNFWFASLADWKAGKTFDSGGGSKTINGESLVLALEFEVDNWVVQTKAVIDDIKINGVTFDFEPSSSASVESVVRDPVISIMVDPTSVDFGTIIRGRDSDPVTFAVTNVGEVEVDITTEILGTGKAFYDSHFYVVSPTVLVKDWTRDDLGIGEVTDPAFYLSVPSTETIGNYDATLIFWASES